MQSGVKTPTYQLAGKYAPSDDRSWVEVGGAGLEIPARPQSNWNRLTDASSEGRRGRCASGKGGACVPWWARRPCFPIDSSCW